MRVTRVYGPHVERSEAGKDHFYCEMAYNRDLKNPDEMVLDLGDFYGRVGRWNDGFEDVHGSSGGLKHRQTKRLPSSSQLILRATLAPTFFAKANW